MPLRSPKFVPDSGDAAPVILMSLKSTSDSEEVATLRVGGLLEFPENVIRCVGPVLADIKLPPTVIAAEAVAKLNELTYPAVIGPLTVKLLLMVKPVPERN